MQASIGWVGLGWVGLGWVGLGWVGLDWIGLDCGVETFQSFLCPFNMSQLFPKSILLHLRYIYGAAWKNCSPCLSVLCTKKRLSPCSSSGVGGGVAYDSPCALRPTGRIC